MSTVNRGIITDSIVLDFDAANIKSYVSGSTIWYDLTKNENNGTLINGVAYNSLNNGSLFFDGSNDYVESTNLTLNSAYTINLWFRQTTALQNKGLVGISGTSGLAYYYIGGSGTVTVYNGGQFGSGIIPSSLTSWNMATWVRRGNTYLVYVNGGSPYTGSLTTALTNTGIIRIGCYPNLASFFNGRISTVQIYNRELIQSEIQQIYNVTKGRYGIG